MRTKYIFLIIFIILVIATIVFFYIRETSQTDIDKKYIDTTVFATDETGSKITTGYRILNNNVVIKEGQTNHLGDILEKIKVDNVITIESFNLENQDYYAFVTEPTLIQNGSLERFKLLLRTPKELIISHSGDLDKDKVINITLKSEYYQNPIFCVKYNSNILRVKTNYEEVDVPKEYKDYFKCYTLDKNIENEEVINLDIDVFSNVLDDDFIKLKIVDRDIVKGVWQVRDNPIEYEI